MNGKDWSYTISAIALLGALIASLPHPVKILLMLMALDLILGGINAFVRRNVTSDEFWMVIAKKAATLVLLAALGASEPILQFDAMDYACVLFVVYELVSITEYAAQLGVPIPRRVAQVLATLRGQYNEQQDHA